MGSSANDPWSNKDTNIKPSIMPKSNVFQTIVNIVMEILIIAGILALAYVLTR